MISGPRAAYECGQPERSGHQHVAGPGPALGGLLLATAGVTTCCAANVLSFVRSLIVLIVHRRVVVPNRPDPARRGDHFTLGLRYASRHRTIRPVML
jgi:hypothetical protein